MSFTDFNDTILIYNSKLDDYSYKQLLIKPSPEEWSIGQVYMHLLNETIYYMEQANCCLANDDNAQEKMSTTAEIIFKNNSLPRQKIKNDNIDALKMKQPSSKAQLQKEMLQLQGDVNHLSKQVRAGKSRGKTRHPGLGYFNAAEWLQFAAMHLRHHLNQLQELDAFLKKQAL
ncbi:MAG: DinB family protein [Ferruginibacter sp.]